MSRTGPRRGHFDGPPLADFLTDRELVLVTDIAALKQLIASREAELETIRATKAVRESGG